MVTEAVPLSKLTPAPWNPRSIKHERFRNLCRSIEADPDFLQLRPILATADGTIFAGNMRYRTAQHLGWENIPAILVDIPEQLARERACATTPSEASGRRTNSPASWTACGPKAATSTSSASTTASYSNSSTASLTRAV